MPPRRPRRMVWQKESRKVYMMGKILSDDGLDLIFRAARTHRNWKDGDLSEVLLEAVYDLAKMGPTSSNSCPMRLVLVRSRAGKERLRPALDKGNVEQTMNAPATAIVGYDLRFYEYMDRLAPHLDARKIFEGKDKLIRETAFRNGSLGGAYFIIAARALGLDCGPMSGFDNAKVDAEFFPDGRIKSNFLCNLGYGDPGKLHPRAARLDFAEACRVV